MNAFFKITLCFAAFATATQVSASDECGKIKSIESVHSEVGDAYVKLTLENGKSYAVDWALNSPLAHTAFISNSTFCVKSTVVDSPNSTCKCDKITMYRKL